MFGRLESVLHSQIAALDQPRAALLVFAVSVLAYNVLALVARSVERAHEPAPEVSFFHLVVQIRSGYSGMMIALPPQHWAALDNTTVGLADRLLPLAKRIRPKASPPASAGPSLKSPRATATAPSHEPTWPQPA